MVKLLELFGGIGACSKALERCGIDYEIVDYVEIDKYAVKSYNAIHNTNFEPQDITTWDKDLKVDLIMHGSPCQDFSIAGNNSGGDKGSGTRSSLMYETIRIVEKLKPRVVIWENVKNLLSKKHKHNFEEYLEYMHNLGYENYYKVLNAKNYGIPQNRERIFTISIRGAHTPFIFPDEMPLELRLKDILEAVVDEKFYLECKYESVTKVNENYSVMNGGLIGKMNDISRRAYDENSIAPAMHTCGGSNTEPKVLVREATKKVYSEAYEGDSINLEQPNSKTRRGRVGHGVAQTLTTSPQQAVEPQVLRATRTEYGKAIRKAYESGEVKESRHNMTELTPRNDGITNTLTTVQKDNYVVEPFIVASRVRNPENPSDRTPGIQLQQRLEPKFDGTTNTITTVQKDNYVVEPSYEFVNLIDDINCGFNPIPKTYTEYSPTLRASRFGLKAAFLKNTQETMLRIRKITPLECWRLMGFDDEDFYKAQAVNSDTQLYKQAGNSIVVNVLCEILNNLREVLEMNKTSETTLTVFETDKFFDIAALAEKEPELFEELVKDYPVTNGVYQYKVG